MCVPVYILDASMLGCQCTNRRSAAIDHPSITHMTTCFIHILYLDALTCISFWTKMSSCLFFQKKLTCHCLLYLSGLLKTPFKNYVLWSLCLLQKTSVQPWTKMSIVRLWSTNTLGFHWCSAKVLSSLPNLQACYFWKCLLAKVNKLFVRLIKVTVVITFPMVLWMWLDWVRLFDPFLHFSQTACFFPQLVEKEN